MEDIMGISAILKSCGNTSRLPDQMPITVVNYPKFAIAKNPEAYAYLRPRAFELVLSAFKSDPKERSPESAVRHMLNVEATAFLHDKDVVHGFASVMYRKDLSTVFIEGVAVEDEHKGGKRMVAALLREIAGVRLKYLALKTQNPQMYSLISHFCKRVWPGPHGGAIPEELRLIGRNLITVGAPLDPETFVLRDNYASCLYPDQLPRNRDWRINDWFHTALRVENGRTRDAFLFIGAR